MKKPGGIALILGMKKKKPGMGGDGMMGEGDGEGKDDPDASADEGLKASADELADIMGVPEDKREAFASAMHNYVKMCAEHEEQEPDEEDDSESEY